jgi:YVTN family beta-propeller protein
VQDFNKVMILPISGRDELRVCALCYDTGMVFIIDPKKKPIYQQVIGSVFVGTVEDEAGIEMMMMPDNRDVVVVINLEQGRVTVFSAVDGHWENQLQPVIPDTFQPDDQLKRVVLTRYETYVVCKKQGRNNDTIFVFREPISQLQSNSIAIKEVEMEATCGGAAVDRKGHWFVAVDTSGKLLVIWNWKRYEADQAPRANVSSASAKKDKETDERDTTNERGELLSIDNVELGEIRPQQNDPRQYKLRNAWNTKYYNDREEFNDGQSTKYSVGLQLGIPTGPVQMVPDGSASCGVPLLGGNAAILYQDGEVKFTKTEAGDAQDPVKKVTFSSAPKPAKGFNTFCCVSFWGCGIITILLGIICFIALLTTKTSHVLPVSPPIPRHEAFFPDLGGRCVWVHDLITDQPIARISGIGTPYAAAATPNGAFVYVTDAFDNTVSVIATASYTVIATIFVETGPKDIAIVPDGTEVWVTHQIHQSIYVISTKENTVIAKIPVMSDPQRPVFHPGRVEAYVVNTGSDTVSVVELDTHRLKRTVDVGPSPRNIAMVDKTKAYVTIEGNHSVGIIDVDNERFDGTISIGMEPCAVVVIAEKQKAYVTNSASNTVSVIDITSHQVLLNISVGRQPEQLVLHPNRTRVYVENRSSQTSSVIDVDTNQVIATIILPVRGPVSSMTMTPDGHYMIATHDNEEHVSVVDTTTNTAKPMLIGSNDPRTKVSLQAAVFTKWD